MKRFKNKPAVLQAAESRVAKQGEDEVTPEICGDTFGETRLDGGAEGSGEAGIAGHKKNGLEVGWHPGCTLNRKTAGRWCEWRCCV